ncbi:MAG: hypothetical protein PHC44_04980 [Lutispora sp.]|nr:hypothetical protein [Lutispora sp.]
MHNYCSIISKEYIQKGLLLYNSLEKHDQNFCLYFICLDEEVKSLLEIMKLEKSIILTIGQIENDDPKLANIKATRSKKEYAWTSKASIFLYLFKNYPEIDHILWLDGDIVFNSSPEPIFQEMGLCSVLLTKERFKGQNIKLNNIYGIYNTGLMGFKRDKNAINFIKWYRKKCIEWCYNKIIPGKWSDQMYLNKIHEKFNWIRVSKNIGINVTAWNIQGCRIEKVNDDIYIDGKKLIFYHYSGFVYVNDEKFELCNYIDLQADVVKFIYIPYVSNYKQMTYYVNDLGNILLGDLTHE